VPVSEVRRYETELIEFLKANHAAVLDTIRETKALPDEAELEKALSAFKETFDTGKVD
jgi:F-type H+-transporting ATPase subunit alpha